MKHAEIKADHLIERSEAARADLPLRIVVVDDVEYAVQLKPSMTRVDHRFDSSSYALVQLPDRWNAVVPAPPGVDDVAHLWHRELIDLIERAKLYVNMRKSA
jgi:hypothetical protein